MNGKVVKFDGTRFMKVEHPIGWNYFLRIALSDKPVSVLSFRLKKIPLGTI